MGWGSLSIVSLVLALAGSLPGPVQASALFAVPNRSLSLAVPEPDGAAAPRHFVRDAQRALQDLGYEPGPIDGVVGPKTRAALVAYQRAEGLPVTGRLDGETMVRLDIRERVFRQAR